MSNPKKRRATTRGPSPRGARPEGGRATTSRPAPLRLPTAGQLLELARPVDAVTRPLADLLVPLLRRLDGHHGASYHCEGPQEFTAKRLTRELANLSVAADVIAECVDLLDAPLYRIRRDCDEWPEYWTGERWSAEPGVAEVYEADQLPTTIAEPDGMAWDRLGKTSAPLGIVYQPVLGDDYPTVELVQ